MNRDPDDLDFTRHPRPASRAQRGYLVGLCHKLGMHSEQLSTMLEQHPDFKTGLDDLSADQASRAIDYLKSWLDI